MTTSVQRATVGASSAGFVSALFLGCLYLLWALFVVSGAAQLLMNFIFRLHFIRPIYVIQDIDPLRALCMVLLSVAGGYAFGSAFALMWNRRHR